MKILSQTLARFKPLKNVSLISRTERDNNQVDRSDKNWTIKSFIYATIRTLFKTCGVRIYLIVTIIWLKLIQAHLNDRAIATSISCGKIKLVAYQHERCHQKSHSFENYLLKDIEATNMLSKHIPCRRLKLSTEDSLPPAKKDFMFSRHKHNT